MNREDWLKDRNDRSMRYAGRVLDPKKWICIKTSQAYAETYAGQVATLVAANLLGRMSPSVALDVPDVHIVAPLPWAGANLRETAQRILRGCDPECGAEIRTRLATDRCLYLGNRGVGEVVHGVGWNTYVGPGPSPLSDSDNKIPIGPAFAVVTAVAQLFQAATGAALKVTAFDTLHWKNEIELNGSSQLPEADTEFGNIWVAGAGSVGTAVLYFLTLFSRNFEAHLFDHDKVKIHNLDRSPIFMNSDVGAYKAKTTAAYLKSIGVSSVDATPSALHEAEPWSKRQQGSPDILVSAANEFNVRHQIEGALPPIQIYGTTGKDWQVTLLRHIPFVDDCSRCVFDKNEETAEMKCATGRVATASGARIDAALPFLSFAAGLMAAAEILKLQMDGYPFNGNRAFLNTWETPNLTTTMANPKAECQCVTRSKNAHRQMIAGTRYACLSL